MAVIVLVTVGLTRAAAEGGIYWFHIDTGPFHLMKSFGATEMVPRSVLAPLMPLYSVLFTDIKTFMAPWVMNSFKMQEETRAARKWFHASVIAAILVTVVVSFAVLLYLVYGEGANRANEWFFTVGPRACSTTPRCSSAEAPPPASSTMGFLPDRRRLGCPEHAMRAPVLLVAAPDRVHDDGQPADPPVGFSFFIGWCCKKLAVRYGGRHMFAKLRPAFIGLIFGELMACFVWSVVAATFAPNKVSIGLTHPERPPPPGASVVELRQRRPLRIGRGLWTPCSAQRSKRPPTRRNRPSVRRKSVR